jgi:hypothetical protein
VSDFPNALTFLESVAGFNQSIAKGAVGSANEPVRLAVIDPSYTASSYPGTLPKVTFEGEDTMSDKRYPVVGTYKPIPSDRVVMLPVGHTYVIVGALNTPIAQVIDGDVVELNPGSNTDSTTGATYTNWLSFPSTTIPTWASACRFLVVLDGCVQLTGTATSQLRLVFAGTPHLAQPKSRQALNVTFTRSWGGRITGISPGTATVVIQARQTQDTGAIRFEPGNSWGAVHFWWEP